MTVKYLTAFISVAVAATALLTGCTAQQETEPAAIRIVGGDQQMGPAGHDCSQPVVVEVLGVPRQNALGGKATRRPVPGVALRFEPVDAMRGVFLTGPEDVVTDAAGQARTTVRLGPKFGDQYLRVSLPDFPGLTTKFRFISGVEISGNNLETLAGEQLPRPISVRVTNTDGNPVPGIPIYITLEGKAKSAKLKSVEEITDEAGVASVQLVTAPWVTRKYDMLVEVGTPDHNFTVRGITIHALAMNRLGMAIGVLGGLAVFILGMEYMSEGLQRVAGKRLKSVLQFFTRNRFAAVGAGAVVTGLIQSSSACTVMVVGFVNAGLLALHQAIGIIFGAAIGTTITGQLVSMKLDSLALPAVAVGVTVRLLARRSNIRNWGQTLLGFGLLFLGMSMMSQQLQGIAEFPSFIRFFNTFDCQPQTGWMPPFWSVVGAVGIGTLLTLIVQSSSATIGLTIVLATSGLINFYTAIPLILGDNIGTTITALLASIGTNRRARQAAIAHTIFKIVGAAYMVALLYVPVNGVPVFLEVVDRFTAGDVFAATPENIGRHVASAHTLFNVFNVIVFLPLIGFLIKIAEMILPAKDDEVLPVQALEPHLLDTPSLALQQAIAAVHGMTESAWRLTSDVYETVRGTSAVNSSFARREEEIDTMQHDITQYLVELTERTLSENQAQAIPLLIHCVNDAERIGDHAGNLARIAVELADLKAVLSDKAARDLDMLFSMVTKQFANVQDALQTGSEEAAADALRLRGKLTMTVRECRNNDVKRLRKGKMAVDVGILFVEIVANLGRIAEHLGNIAERAVELSRHLSED